MGPLELWGGPECSLTRVGALYRDQTVLSGHHDRIEDLDLFAALGFRALRYPVLWERIEAQRGRRDWSWTDRRLARIRDLGMRPVAGLLHHGSGPGWTSLLDPDFAASLAAFAGEAARRYPWITDWTPVNEPLTTARFSALYGHWHPHGRDERLFWIALLNQIDGVRLSMRAIRETIPEARLIQTEDFGQTFATAPCQSQADHENQRRLMTWDLLCGRVVRGHALFDRLEGFGLADRLAAISADACPPVIGLNHYLTSDRFLDHRLDRYPAAAHGGNGRIAYADVEAVRALDPPPPGWAGHIDTIWDRYGLDIVVTECHLGCSREEQLRWLHECWVAALEARAAGVRVEAVTVWSLLGAYDWNSLLTRPDDVYESGAFDLSEGWPRPTALAALAWQLARQAVDINVAKTPGWWRRPQRLLYPPHPSPIEDRRRPFSVGPQAVQSACGSTPAELELECALRDLQLGPAGGDPHAAPPWLFTADPSVTTARALDLMIDTAVTSRHDLMPCFGQMEIGADRRV